MSIYKRNIQPQHQKNNNKFMEKMNMNNINPTAIPIEINQIKQHIILLDKTRKYNRLKLEKSPFFKNLKELINEKEVSKEFAIENIQYGMNCFLLKKRSIIKSIITLSDTHKNEILIISNNKSKSMSSQKKRMYISEIEKVHISKQQRLVSKKTRKNIKNNDNHIDFIEFFFLNKEIKPIKIGFSESSSIYNFIFYILYLFDIETEDELVSNVLLSLLKQIWPKKYEFEQYDLDYSMFLTVMMRLKEKIRLVGCGFHTKNSISKKEEEFYIEIFNKLDVKHENKIRFDSFTSFFIENYSGLEVYPIFKQYSNHIYNQTEVDVSKYLISDIINLYKEGFNKQIDEKTAIQIVIKYKISMSHTLKESIEEKLLTFNENIPLSDEEKYNITLDLLSFRCFLYDADFNCIYNRQELSAEQRIDDEQITNLLFNSSYKSFENSVSFLEAYSLDMIHYLLNENVKYIEIDCVDGNKGDPILGTRRKIPKRKDSYEEVRDIDNSLYIKEMTMIGSQLQYKINEFVSFTFPNVMNTNQSGSNSVNNTSKKKNVSKSYSFDKEEAWLSVKVKDVFELLSKKAFENNDYPLFIKITSNCSSTQHIVLLRYINEILRDVYFYEKENCFLVPTVKELKSKFIIVGNLECKYKESFKDDNVNRIYNRNMRNNQLSYNRVSYNNNSISLTQSENSIIQVDEPVLHCSEVNIEGIHSEIKSKEDEINTQTQIQSQVFNININLNINVNQTQINSQDQVHDHEKIKENDVERKTDKSRVVQIENIRNKYINLKALSEIYEENQSSIVNRSNKSIYKTTGFQNDSQKTLKSKELKYNFNLSSKKDHKKQGNFSFSTRKINENKINSLNKLLNNEFLGKVILLQASEESINKISSSSKEKEELISISNKNLIEIEPTHSLDESNIHPTKAWTCGVQIVKMNYMNEDENLIINKMLFQQNKGKGIIKKEIQSLNQGKIRKIIKIEMISAINLHAFLDFPQSSQIRNKQTNTNYLMAYNELLISSKVIGSWEDEKFNMKYESVYTNTKLLNVNLGNRSNVNNIYVFNIYNEEYSFLIFDIKLNSNTIAKSIIPVKYIQEGIRAIPIYNTSWEESCSGVLLGKVSFLSIGL